MTDYRNLCFELFGTTDENEIRKQVDELKNRNKTGRKPLLDEEQRKQLLLFAEQGMSVNELAEKYNTSRQVIGRYLNKKATYNYSIRLTYMFKQYPCTVIDADYLNKRIKIQNRTDDIIHRAFGIKEAPTWADYEMFLESRCYPKSRANIKEILHELNMDHYDTLKMIEKTQGRTYEDDMWIRIQKNVK